MAAGTPRRRRLLRLRGETRPGINSFCEKIRSNMKSHGSIFSFDNLLAAAAATAMLLPSACSEDPMADNAFSGPMLRFEVVDRHGWQTPSQSRAAGDITVDATDSTTLLHPDIFILRGGGGISGCRYALPACDGYRRYRIGSLERARASDPCHARRRGHFLRIVRRAGVGLYRIVERNFLPDGLYV